MTSHQDLAVLCLRLATAANFLSPVASRLGLWGGEIWSFGIKEAPDYSVFVDCTAAFLLATRPRYRWSLDQLRRNGPA